MAFLRPRLWNCSSGAAWRASPHGGAAPGTGGEGRATLRALLEGDFAFVDGDERVVCGECARPLWEAAPEGSIFRGVTCDCHGSFRLAVSGDRALGTH